MANEITLSVNFLAAKNGASVSAVVSKSITMPDGSDDMNSQTVSVAFNASVAMPVGIVAAGGLTAIKNLSAAGNVYVGPTSADASPAAAIAAAFFLVAPGEVAVFRRSSVALFLRATDLLTLLAQVTTVEP